MNYSIDNLLPLVFGRKNNTYVSSISFDCSAWTSKFPSLSSWKIEAILPCGEVIEPIVTFHNNILTWEITDKDTSCAGRGSYQIIAEGTEIRKLSAHPAFYVLKDLQSDSDSSCDCADRPMSAEEATEKMLEMLQKAEDAARQAEEAAEQLAECDICNGTAEIIFNGGDSDSNIFDAEEDLE